MLQGVGTFTPHREGHTEGGLAGMAFGLDGAHAVQCRAVSCNGTHPDHVAPDAVYQHGLPHGLSDYAADHVARGCNVLSLCGESLLPVAPSCPMKLSGTAVDALAWL